MESNFLTQLFEDAARSTEEKASAQKKSDFFRELGKKGGRKKTSNNLVKIISIRLTQDEFASICESANKLELSNSKYLRLLLTEKELRVNEFKTDEVLLGYANNFIRIRNLLRKTEWSEFENKKEILNGIEEVLMLTKKYLYAQDIKKTE